MENLPHADPEGAKAMIRDKSFAFAFTLLMPMETVRGISATAHVNIASKGRHMVLGMT